jgi:uncharacterized protein (DUF433 family)
MLTTTGNARLPTVWLFTVDQKAACAAEIVSNFQHSHTGPATLSTRARLCFTVWEAENEMAESARAPSGTPDDKARPLPSRAILRLIAKGMSIRAIVQLFPELSADEVRASLLRVADLAQDETASLPAEDPIAELIERVQNHAALDEDEAMALAVEAANEVRKKKESKG